MAGHHGYSGAISFWDDVSLPLPLAYCPSLLSFAPPTLNFSPLYSRMNLTDNHFWDLSSGRSLLRLKNTLNSKFKMFWPTQEIKSKPSKTEKKEIQNFIFHLG